MDQTVLVKSDRDIGAKIIDALSRVHFPITLWDWAYIPQLVEWQLIIASPWVKSKGPRTTYRAMVDALQKASIYDQAPVRRVFLRSPDDPLVKALEREVKEQNEGFLHILKDQDRAEYSVIFAPVTRTGGAVPRRVFSTLNDVKDFLASDLGLRASAINDALREMEISDASSIFPVTLTTRQIKKLSLD